MRMRGPDLSKPLDMVSCPHALKSLAKILCPKHTRLHCGLSELSGDIRDISVTLSPNLLMVREPACPKAVGVWEEMKYHS